MLSKRIAVIGIGNLLLKDEGVGVHIVHALQEIQLPDNVDIIDGGTSPDIFYRLEGVDKLIIIDAARAGGEPGAVYRFDQRDIPWEARKVISLHEVGLLESLEIMEVIGDRPKQVVIIGIEPKEIDWGLELSPELEEMVPQVVGLVLEEINRGLN